MSAITGNETRVSGTIRVLERLLSSITGAAQDVPVEIWRRIVYEVTRSFNIGRQRRAYQVIADPDREGGANMSYIIRNFAEVMRRTSVIPQGTFLGTMRRNLLLPHRTPELAGVRLATGLSIDPITDEEIAYRAGR
jgi:hypothetical protein